MNNFYKELDFRVISLAVVCCFPILKFNIASITIILFSLISIGLFLRKKEKLKYYYTKHLLLNSLFFFLLAISLVYTSNIISGIGTVQRTLSILIFPLIIFFFNQKITLKELNILLWVFAITCLVLTIYIYGNLIVDGVFNSLLENDIKFWDNPFRDTLFGLKYVVLHPTYYSLWILFTALFLINKTFGQKNHFKIISLIFLSIFLIVTAVLFSARGPLLGFFFAFFCMVILHLESLKYRLYFLLATIIIITVSVTQISFLRSRFIEEFEAQKFRPPVGNAHTSTNIRVGIYTCVFQIFNENKLLGVGIGDVQDELNACYKQFHTRVYEEKDYNSHSSYFNLLLSNGILGLIAFLAVLFYQTKLAYFAQSKLYLAFIILIVTCMFFENILIRMHGAVFYALFNSIFVKHILTDNSTVVNERI